ncbi:hypothetical protein F5Y16DRAFT_382403 [Xylariaceae sp. FL0255]|nr:hypothetical protein F5Y16DRAFT_382403 [Xylariaceae sp. FL0255]
MAGASPTRRSSRARIPQSQSQIPSATSSSSGRTERSTRAFTKTGSPQKSTGTGSLSSEPPEDSATATTNNDDTILRRRSTRGKDDERDKKPKTDTADMPPADDDIPEDDGLVRCICGHEDYPGPPPFDEDSKHGVKDAIDHDRIFAIEITDDMAGFFVQCEICNTWQHGACVGFTTEDSNPDDLEYFCEQCRKDLHKIYTASNGQKYSIFLPIHRPSQAPSRATSATNEGAKSPKPGSKAARAAAAAQTSKRRSTMNSRDAAYDEEEQLRQAIEASKEETIPEESEVAIKRPKRGRDDREENTESVKRQRTNSKSPSPTAENPDAAVLDESDDETALRNDSKRSRNALRNQRERTEREERREEQERKRAEAASKRKGRAERRRADDSDPSEEIPLATRSAAANRASESAQPPEPPAPSSQPLPDSPPSAQPPVTTQKKKTTQPKKKGRNQYTKDRDNDHEGSPARSISRDITKTTDENGSSNTKSTHHESTGKHGKNKGGMNSRVTMSDMKRRVNGILEYISRKQVELVNDPISDSAPESGNNSVSDDQSTTKVKSPPQDKSPTEDPSPTTNGVVNPEGLAELAAAMSKDFKDMSCVEMMDALSRDLVKWQQEFAPS